MMDLLTVNLNQNKEFKLIAIADIVKNVVTFQGLINGVPFISSDNYEHVRESVMNAVSINKPTQCN
jgi:hypothetical protein